MYIYKGDSYCDSCGDAICKSLTAQGKAPADVSNESSYESSNFPKRCGDDDDHGNSDTPCHCANNALCKNAVDISPAFTAGKLLGTNLTKTGVQYIVDAIEESREDNAVTKFWAKQFSPYYRSIAKAAEAKWPTLMESL